MSEKLLEGAVTSAADGPPYLSVMFYSDGATWSSALPAPDASGTKIRQPVVSQFESDVRVSTRP